MSNDDKIQKGWGELTETFQKLLSLSSRSSLKPNTPNDTPSSVSSASVPNASPSSNTPSPKAPEVSEEPKDLEPFQPASPDATNIPTQTELFLEENPPVLEDKEVVSSSPNDPNNTEEDHRAVAPSDTDASPPTLSQDWQFLMEADLGEEEEEETPEAKMSAMLHQGSVVDVVDLEELESTASEVEELVANADRLLDTLETNSKDEHRELYRAIHTLKGTLGITGEARARALIHHLETTLDEINDGLFSLAQKKEEIFLFFDKATTLMNEVRSGNWSPTVSSSEEASVPPEQPSVLLPKSVNVNVVAIDKMIGEINEGRLDNIALEEFFVSSRNKLKELEENAQRAFKMLRELELQAEIQIQSRKSQLQEVGEDFDPLEFDRFTKLQELSRITSESLIDILEVRRELMKFSVDQEALLAHQRRAIVSAQERLHKTRLVQADAINDRLYKLVRKVSKDEEKNITFEMSGGRVELDRVLLDKITPALEHILRNSIVHGVEPKHVREQLNKPSTSTISLSVHQEAGRAFIEIHDDGYGLKTESIRQKAIEKGLWQPQDPMSDEQAAEMICTPSFSTASEVSINAGRGVGMDAVRSAVLALGGKFEIQSRPTKGLSVFIQLPTSITQASVLVVESGNEEWAFPVEMVEHVILLSKESLQKARQEGVFPNEKGLTQWAGASFRLLEDMTGVHSASSIRSDNAPVLLLKERGQLLALEVSRLIQVFEVPLHPAGGLWTQVRSVAGTVVLPNGNAIFLLDPFRFQAITHPTTTEDERPVVASAPLVMVVDDSLTVRKATVRFLHKNGFESITAKDGQEALDLLLRVNPKVILLDIEMPKMDGFDCAKAIRDNPKHAQTPIVMITSRTAEKHRNRARSLGVNEYLGKPFKDEELLALLKSHTD